MNVSILTLVILLEYYHMHVSILPHHLVILPHHVSILPQNLAIVLYASHVHSSTVSEVENENGT